MTGNQPLSGRALLVALSIVTAIGPLSIDMYLPALPTLVADLRFVEGGGEATLGAFILGFGAGQLLHGPLADRFGRRGPLLCGLLIALVASAGCALASTQASHMALRFLAGVGASAGLVISRAIIRDIYPRDAAAGAFSVLVTVVGAAPLLAPLAGGQILAFGGWRMIFWTLSVLALLAILAAATLVPETLPRERRLAGAWRPALSSYARILGEQRYLGFALAGALVYSGMFAYIAAAPAVLIVKYAVSPQHFGLLFGLNAGGFMLGGIINRGLVGRFGAPRLLEIAGWTAFAAGVAMVALILADAVSLPRLMALLCLFTASVGIVGANSAACCLDLFPERAGAAAAVFGATQFAAGALGTAVISSRIDDVQLLMALVIAVASGLGLLLKRVLTTPISGATRLA
jgi:MFS transporter, DHA1 family, multidrug resistance protein